MISGKQKAWAATTVGILITALNYIAAMLADGQTKVALVAVSGVVAIVGSGLGVYSVPNTVNIPPDTVDPTTVASPVSIPFPPTFTAPMNMPLHCPDPVAVPATPGSIPKDAQA